MAQTAQTIITRAARSLGYLGRTSTLSAADANDALVIFNAMLDSWSNENLLSFVVLEQSFPLVVNQSAYTIGPVGANITAARPLDITQAYVQDNGNNNFIITILPILIILALPFALLGWLVAWLFRRRRAKKEG